jgi:hypothetical protein
MIRQGKELAMSRTLTLSEDELDEIERVLALHSRSTLLEIHRTDSTRFRQEVEGQYQLEERILRKLHEARQTASV